MVLHANLPEDLTLVPAAHQELQRVLVGPLETRRSHTETDRCHDIERKTLKLKADGFTINLYCNTHVNLRVEFDQEAFSLEAQLANLGPVEGVYFCVALEEERGEKVCNKCSGHGTET